MSEVYVGAMSGTSLDGVDAVVVDFSRPLNCLNPGAPEQQRTGRQAMHTSAVLAHAHRPFPADLRAELLALNHPGDNELHRASRATRALAEAYHETITASLKLAGLPASRIQAAGVHGQTVRHRPLPADGGYTVQLDPGAWLSTRLGIDLVSDFRSQDVALGGQGAPLVPAFHDEVFREAGRNIAVINLGGIANITWLPSDGATLGFDTGPGNALLDAWSQRHRGVPFDEGGQWAASGQVIDSLLAVWLSDAYFAAAAPKSTGRDQFNMVWTDAGLARWQTSFGSATPRPQDVQATLTQLTAVTCMAPVRAANGLVHQVWVCGGGARNSELMSRMATQWPHTAVNSTAEAGWPVDQVEAVAFAWLARKRLLSERNTLPAVTGAQQAVSAGAWRRHVG